MTQATRAATITPIHPDRTLQPKPYDVTGWAEAEGMDRWLDNLETILTAIGQRRMTRDQLYRFGRLIAESEQRAVGWHGVRTK